MIWGERRGIGIGEGGVKIEEEWDQYLGMGYWRIVGTGSVRYKWKRCMGEGGGAFVLCWNTFYL